MSHSDWSSLARLHLQPGLVTISSLLGRNTAFVSAHGCIVEDDSGTEYLDFLAGYGSLSLGHNHPSLLEAISRPFPGFMPGQPNTESARLAGRLATLTPAGLTRAFFCNSGTEAVEAALKLTRAATQRKRFLSFVGAYHGKTFGSLSVTHNQRFREPFEPLVPSVTFVDFGDSEAAATELASGDYAAVIVEPIQGEGGVMPAPPGFLNSLRDYCDAHGTYLIVDEVQTGLARTGAMFAVEHEAIRPDVMCVAKSLGGGVFPLGACLSTDAIWASAFNGLDSATLQTTTFGGSARAASAGLATLQVIEDESLSARAGIMGGYLRQSLQELADSSGLISDVRGRGLMLGIELTEQLASVVLPRLSGAHRKALVDRSSAEILSSVLAREFRILTGVTLSRRTVLRVQPPLIVTREQVDHFVSSLGEVLS